MQIRNLSDEPITLEPDELLQFAGFLTDDGQRVVITDADELAVFDANDELADVLRA